MFYVTVVRVRDQRYNWSDLNVRGTGYSESLMGIEPVTFISPVRYSNYSGILSLVVERY